MASINVAPPRQITNDHPLWYPVFDPNLSAQTNRALRRAFDLIYQQQASGGLTELIVSGLMNNANKVFALSRVPVNLLLFRNGVLQRPGASHDYIIAGVKFTVAIAPDPAAGEWFRAFDAGSAAK